jgi:lysophospholipase L1-like esterase
MMKIVFLGDSLTWGGYGGNFVDEVAKEMPEHTIINEGVGGDTVVNLLRRVESVIEEHKPDAMFVMVGGNDATSYTMPATRNYYRKAKQLENGMVTPEEFETTYRELLHQIQLQHVLPLVGIAPTEYSKDLVKAKQSYNAIVKKLTEKLNIPLLDLDSPFTPAEPIEREATSLKFIQEIGEHVASGWDDFESERQKWGYSYTFDGMHLLPQTAIKFAKLIVPFLKKHVL